MLVFLFRLVSHCDAPKSSLQSCVVSTVATETDERVEVLPTYTHDSSPPEPYKGISVMSYAVEDSSRAIQVPMYHITRSTISYDREDRGGAFMSMAVFTAA